MIEQKCQIRVVRVHEPETAKIVSVISWNRGEPGVQQVVPLIEYGRIMGREAFETLRDRALDASRVKAM